MLHVAALSLAPMSMVQAVVAGGVAMIAVMADRMFGFQVGRRQWWGLGLTTAGLVLLAITMPRTGGTHDSFSVAAMISFQGVLLGVGGLLILGPRAAGAHEKHHGVALAAAAGVLFGVCNVAVKALSGLVGDAGVMALVSPWTAGRARRLGRRLLRLGPQPAGRRGRPGHRDHRHRRIDLLHRRRHPRLRRSDARRPRSASSARRSPSCW